MQQCNGLSVIYIAIKSKILRKIPPVKHQLALPICNKLIILNLVGLFLIPLQNNKNVQGQTSQVCFLLIILISSWFSLICLLRELNVYYYILVDCNYTSEIKTYCFIHFRMLNLIVHLVKAHTLVRPGIKEICL